MRAVLTDFCKFLTGHHYQPTLDYCWQEISAILVPRFLVVLLTLACLVVFCL